MTGFRLSRSGWFGLEGPQGASTGGAPDLFTFGKVMGGGFPAAAFGGRAEVMQRLAPAGPVYQAGTLSGNPVATAAGLATLQHADDAVYARVDHVASTIAGSASACLAAVGVPHTVGRAGSMFSVFFGHGPDGGPVRDYDAARHGRTPTPSARSSTRCSRRGVYLPPSAFESWFVSAAHDDEAVGQVLDALPHAAAAAAAALEGPHHRRLSGP